MNRVQKVKSEFKFFLWRISLNFSFYFFQGFPQKRSCTDILCLLLFIACIAGWCFIAHFVWLNSNKSHLLKAQKLIERNAQNVAHRALQIAKENKIVADGIEVRNDDNIGRHLIIHFQYGEDVLNDLKETYLLILCHWFGAAIFCTIFIAIYRFFVAPLTWLLLLSINLSLSSSKFIFSQKYHRKVKIKYFSSSNILLIRAI